jgi:dUTP pyrophosphatase
MITNGTTLMETNSIARTIISTLNIQCLRLTEDAELPKRQHPTDAGADLCCIETIDLYPEETKAVGTGIAVKIPVGFVGLIFNRSSQGKRGIILPNSVGVIDSDYRGELKVLLKNISGDLYKIKQGDRIAQLVIVPIQLATFTDCWNDTQRGTGGFGSTGT